MSGRKDSDYESLHLYEEELSDLDTVYGLSHSLANQNRVNRQSSVGTNLHRQPSTLSTYSALGKYPPLSHKGSIVLPRTPILVDANQSRMAETQGIDESIFAWKALNLSRAKLKASSRTSALLSGFAMVAMVEIQIDEEIPEGLLIAFAVCTVLLISVHMLALMISTCILPNVEAVSNLHLQTTNTVNESPHTKMKLIIELAWGFSTVIGILLFLIEILILCWVKFYRFNGHRVAWVSTCLLIPIICIFLAFAAHFYLKIVSHKSEVYETNIKELELLKDQLDDRQDVSDQEDMDTRMDAVKIV
jgi:calcium release-activated calcium channel protein 1